MYLGMPGTGNLAKNPWFLGVGWGGSITITLLNGHLILSLPLKSVSAYPLLVQFSDPSRDVSLCSEWWVTQKLRTCPDTDCPPRNGTSVSYPLLERLRDNGEREGRRPGGARGRASWSKTVFWKWQAYCAHKPRAAMATFMQAGLMRPHCR